MEGFETKFEDWLEKAFEFDIPVEVAAFSFNLFEGGSDMFGIEIIGASEFDLKNEDWACEEIWEPSQRTLSIPIEYSGEDWQRCLEVMRNLVVKFLSTNKNSARKLKSRNGIGIGFVDGNLEIIWKR